MLIYLADVVSLPGNPPPGSVDGEGNPLTPTNRPAWDTLISVVNKETFPVIARFRFWNEQDGSIVMWPNGTDHGDQVVQPGLSWPTTLIPNNCFTAPPGNFSGHGTIEFLQVTPYGETTLPDNAPVYAWSMLGGGNWDSNSPSCGAPLCKDLTANNQWIFCYAIRFVNADHSGGEGYTTGASIQNFSAVPVNVTIKYIVAQTYPQAGTNWSFTKALPADGGARFDLTQELWKVGMPQGLLSEGHVEITSDVQAMLFIQLIPTTENYLWRASQSAAI